MVSDTPLKHGCPCIPEMGAGQMRICFWLLMKNRSYARLTVIGLS
jgi:hypothetical protein